MPTDWTRFGRLAERYQSSHPRRILTLDGGGIRGLKTLVALQELEKQLAAAYPDEPNFRLCKFFDYIGGTSTGAIIAAALARGLAVSEILGFYRTFGQIAFKKRPFWEKWRTLYSDSALSDKLKDVLGADSTLEPQHLRTLLLIVTRNKSTDSAWPISSNPLAKYNDSSREDCNLRIPLWQLVRASTAAPVYFPPEEVTLGSQTFTFVDGGTTPYNNPAFLLSRMATDPVYKLGWPRGEQNLLVVSFGTGYRPNADMEADRDDTNLLESVSNTLTSLMTQAEYDQDVNCRTVGRCSFGHELDSEIGSLVPDGELSTDTGKGFLYARYDVDISQEGLDGAGLGHLKSDSVARIDATDNLADLEAIGGVFAKHVDIAHLGSFVGTPLFTL